MPGFFDAMKQRHGTSTKKYFVEIDGKSIEVSLKEKQEFISNGADRYMLKDNKLTLKPLPVKKTVYPVLVPCQKGYTFYDGDIHWPNGVEEGGEAWLIEYE